MNSNSLNFFAKGTNSKEYPTNSRKCIMKIYPKGSNRNEGRKEWPAVKNQSVIGIPSW